MDHLHVHLLGGRARDLGGGHAHLVDGGLFGGGDAVDRHFLAPDAGRLRFPGGGFGEPRGLGARALQQRLRVRQRLGAPLRRVRLAAAALQRVRLHRAPVAVAWPVFWSLASLELRVS